MNRLNSYSLHTVIFYRRITTLHCIVVNSSYITHGLQTIISTYILPGKSNNEWVTKNILVHLLLSKLSINPMSRPVSNFKLLFCFKNVLVIESIKIVENMFSCFKARLILKCFFRTYCQIRKCFSVMALRKRPSLYYVKK